MNELALNVFKKKEEWLTALRGSLRIEDDIMNIPGMKEAQAIKDPEKRNEAVHDAMLYQMEILKWMNGLVMQQSHQMMILCLGILSISCVMDVAILAFHMGWF